MLFLFMGNWSQLHAETNEVEVEVNGEGELKQEIKKKSYVKKSTKNWAKMNFDAIEKEWEGGDDDEELEHEYEHNQKVQERKNKANPRTIEQIIKSAKSDPLSLNVGQGGAMMFVKLRELKKKGAAWTENDVDKLAKRWSSLLRSAAIDVKVVNIGANGAEEEKNSLLISVDKGWTTYDVMKFILKQKETIKLTYNSKDYTFKDLPKDEDE
jgi:hypothetical protein